MLPGSPEALDARMLHLHSLPEPLLWGSTCSKLDKDQHQGWRTRFLSNLHTSAKLQGG